ncbi:unnamed protein product [Rhizoctonia solani]|uniref:XPG-I domain-containing protein n=1 Tax=Rhizoctonia solani TaxID=456999 RepID=A0A8H3CL09_9AGAM|nr:unnamed protein product [Rhizoctonia solani]
MPPTNSRKTEDSEAMKDYRIMLYRLDLATSFASFEDLFHHFMKETLFDGFIEVRVYSVASNPGSPTGAFPTPSSRLSFIRDPMTDEIIADRLFKPALKPAQRPYDPGNLYRQQYRVAKRYPERPALLDVFRPFVEPLLSDGTLITQRLFYAPDSRPYRHVLGWYQLIQELRQNKINVICVFDGKGRISAKQGEVERRRLLRAQAEVRGVWEKSRHQRLLSLTQALRGLEGLPTEHQQEVFKTLQVDPPLLPKDDLLEVVTPGLVDTTKNQEDMNYYPAPESSTDASLSTRESLSPEGPDPPGHGLASIIGPGFPLNEEMLSASGKHEQVTGNIHSQVSRSHRDARADESMPEEIVRENVARTTPPTETSLSEIAQEIKDNEEYSEKKAGRQDPLVESSKNQPIDQHQTGLDVNVAEPTMGDTRDLGNIADVKLKADSLQNEDIRALTHRILDLLDHYNLTNTAGPDGTIPASGVLTGVHDAPSIPISKIQLKYTQEEAKLWKQLVTPSDNPTIDLARAVEAVEQFVSVELPQDEIPSDEITIEDAEEPISERSAQLEERSGRMAASFARRANPPTALTYAESRLILEAMGIPCLQSSLPYEAEALACSLVLNGLADFVGSEDTDVLMYNAPLLRNMTDRKLPLQVIPPSVETHLGLSRSAFVDTAILMGTDFVKRVAGVGPTTAWRLMNQYGSIEAMLEQESKFRPSDVAEYLERVKVARMIFGTIPPAPTTEDVTPGKWNEQAIYDVMSRFELQRHLDEFQVIPDALSANYYDDDSESKPPQ